MTKWHWNIYTWTPDGKGGGVLSDGENEYNCPTLDAAHALMEGWGEDVDDAIWEVNDAD